MGGLRRRLAAIEGKLPIYVQREIERVAEEERLAEKEKRLRAQGPFPCDEYERLWEQVDVKEMLAIMLDDFERWLPTQEKERF